MENHEATIIQLECDLLNPDFRRDRDKLAALLAEDFHEIGASGRVYDRADVLRLLPGDADVCQSMHEASLHRLAPDVALLTYTSERRCGTMVRRTLRSSIWICTAAGWRIRYHQGTLLPEALHGDYGDSDGCAAVVAGPR